MAIEDYQDLVTSLTRDPDELISTGQRDQAISLAVVRYSQDLPRRLVADDVVPATGFLDLPDGFDTDQHRIEALECPPDRIPPAVLSGEDWALYQGVDAIRIMLISRPPTGAAIRIRYTGAHVLDDETDTIPAKHREAVASWAAAILCEQLASQYSGDQIPTVNADSVDHQSKGRDFANRAKTLRKFYYDSIGVDPKRNVAAGVVVDLDLPDSRGLDRIWKRRGLR